MSIIYWSKNLEGNKLGDFAYDSESRSSGTIMIATVGMMMLTRDLANGSLSQLQFGASTVRYYVIYGMFGEHCV